ncbi:MAG: Gfo/Idh/MocA family oxidoreductase, partial [Anaerolineae bacterium]|nr:Gfo/Idh/MocA family oxidoreductase [Anaerolineae bacterium]
MKVNVGIIGAGNMGRTHAVNLKADRRAKIAGVTDTLQPRAQALAEAVGARAFPSVEDLLGADVEAVYITTPNTRHKDAALAALQRGIHVFCEKPMATSLAEAGQVLRAARASKAVYQAGHNRRFAPVYRYLKAQIDQGFRPYLA